MSTRLRIANRHDIEWESRTAHPFLNQVQELREWLEDCGVSVMGEESTEVEVEKEGLRNLTEEDFANAKDVFGIPEAQARDFVKDLLDSPASETHAWFAAY